MVLKLDRSFAVRRIGRQSDVRRMTSQFHMVLNEYAVVQYGYYSRAYHITVFRKNRGFKYDVVGLPLTWPSRDIDQWNVLLVDRPCLAVGVGHVLVRIKNLHLVGFVEKHPTVASPLSVAFDLCGGSPFNMQLNIAKLLPRSDIARAG